MEGSRSCPIKCKFFRAGINFSFPADSCHAYCLRVGNVLTNRGVLPPHRTENDENSEIFTSFTWNRCLQESIPQGIDYFESMPGVLKCLKFEL